VFDDEADQDHGEEPGEYRGNLELVLVLVDEPAEAARARRNAEYELRGDQRAPRERPTHLEPGKDARECRRDEDRADIAEPREPVIPADHSQRLRYRKKT